MNNQVPGWARRLALLLVVSSALGALGWLWWNSVRRSDISFLPRMSPAEWIVYPTPAQGMTHPRLELGTAFRCGFVLDKAPAQASLRVAGFRRYSISLNGKPVDAPVRRGRNWKQADVFEAGGRLAAGQNEIVVTVFNSNGPPALWLALETGTVRLVSSEAWEASLAGASWQNAQLATRPKPVIAGSQLYGGGSVWECLRGSWRIVSIFALVSAAAYWLMTKVRRTDAKKEWLLILGLIVVWEAVFTNNVGALPELYGFDAVAHMQYVGYILERGSLPLANEGFEMFQPPLYYLICAALLKALGLSVSQPGGIMAIRTIGMVIGVAHFLIVWASLRLLFPEERSKARWGVVLAACLPVLLYLSHYVTNESLSAALVSACVWLCLRMLKTERITWKQCVALGVCLGAAMLAKTTALLVVPLVLAALAWNAVQKSNFNVREWAVKPALVGLVCVAVCGWHYARTWLHFGSPVVGVWDPKLGYSYWQDDGYLTSAYCLRFGEALVNPWFSGLKGFWDGLYSTLWGDGLLGGAAVSWYRPPWNYELMGIGFWLALGPTCAVLAGAVLAVRKFIREPSAEWLLVLGLGFLAGLSLVHMSMVVATGTMAKAFYGLCALVPFCAFGAWGLDFVWQRSGRVRGMLFILVGMFALNSWGSFWISHSSVKTSQAQARSLWEQGQHFKAVAVLDDALAANPQSVETRALLADNLARLGKQKQAQREAERVVKERPDNATAHLVLAQALAGEKKLSEATEEARRAVALAPGDVGAYQVLARLLLDQEQFAELERAARAGLGTDPSNAELRFGLGTALAARGEGREAISQLELACSLRPNWSVPHGLLGGILTAQNRLDEAVAQYSRAVKLDVKNPASHVDLGKALAMQGKLNEATNEFHQALRLEPDNAQAHLELAAVLEKQQAQ